MPFLEEERIIAEFDRRRKRLRQGFAFGGVLIALGLAVRQLVDWAPGFLGIGAAGWTAFAIAQLFAGIAIAVTGFLQYRCPACNQIIRGERTHYLGVDLDPERCPHCGRRLA